MADTFSGLGSIPHQETIYLSSFLEGMLIAHFSGFSFILNVLRLSKVSVGPEMNHSSS
jgi:hypothetical protein